MWLWLICPRLTSQRLLNTEAENEFLHEVSITSYLAAYKHTCVAGFVSLTENSRGILLELFSLRSVEQSVISNKQLNATEWFVQYFNNFGRCLCGSDAFACQWRDSSWNCGAQFFDQTWCISRKCMIWLGVAPSCAFDPARRPGMDLVNELLRHFREKISANSIVLFLHAGFCGSSALRRFCSFGLRVPLWPCGRARRYS